ncbi:MAG: YafY family transcriptional regulator [Anaerolineaceae bacterium]|nr:MAG: YafY family transcriptional regulator [Anaerolineaceae bacterium]
MRADRLLSLLMILQTQGRRTAQELAEELEVSERTIYRDIEALSIAGVPVYATRGPGGGCDLLNSYRTSLTGLNEDEVRALFMVSIPAPLAQLGVDQKLKTALLKITSAMSTTYQHLEQWIRPRIHVDVVPWFQTEEPVPHLATLHQAVNRDRRIKINYQLHFDAQATWVVDPYGLVTKASVWYLVCAREGKIRVYRISRILDVKILDDNFERSEDFELADFWKAWCSDAEESHPRYSVKARISNELLPYIRTYFSDLLIDIDEKTESHEEWIETNLHFETFEAARNRILGFGRAIEVLKPDALRLSVIDFASQIVDHYSG